MKRSFFPLSHQECIRISSIPLEHYIAINLQDNSLRQRVANSVLAVKEQPQQREGGKKGKLLPLSIFEKIYRQFLS